MTNGQLVGEICRLFEVKIKLTLSACRRFLCRQRDVEIGLKKRDLVALYEK